MPDQGQQWTTLEKFAAAGTHIQIAEIEADLFMLEAFPGTGIGQQSKLICTSAGNLLWAPLGCVDADSVALVRDLGEVRAIVASHPQVRRSGLVESIAGRTTGSRGGG